MKEFKYVIHDETGIHARLAGVFIKKAKEFEGKVMLQFKGKRVELRKRMALMSMGIQHGDEVLITVSGEDEETAVKAQEDFMKDHL